MGEEEKREGTVNVRTRDNQVREFDLDLSHGTVKETNKQRPLCMLAPFARLLTAEIASCAHAVLLAASTLPCSCSSRQGSERGAATSGLVNAAQVHGMHSVDSVADKLVAEIASRGKHSPFSGERGGGHGASPAANGTDGVSLVLANSILDAGDPQLRWHPVAASKSRCRYEALHASHLPVAKPQGQH